MQVSDSEFNIILAALRTTALAYEARAIEARKRHDTAEFNRAGAFARACGDLSDRLEKQRPRFFIPRH